MRMQRGLSRWFCFGAALAVWLWGAAVLLTSFSAAQAAVPKTGFSAAVIGALQQELAAVEARMTDKSEQHLMGIRFVTGSLNGRRVVLVRCGIGKVNAAMVTTLVLSRFHPRWVIFTGIAGGLRSDLAPGDIVIATKVTYHDYGGVSAAGFAPSATQDPVTGRKNPRFFACDQRLVKAAEEAAASAKLERVATSRGLRRPRVVKGVVVTGDVFVASPAKAAELRRIFGADVVEMEGAAVAQICWQQKVPFLILRSVSDSAGKTAFIEMIRFLKGAAENSARITMGLISRLAPE
jgi:adenosylhomocysteine nucleosidase